MIRLSVNVNKVALLRNTRDIGLPSVLKAAQTAIAAGAHGITVHPRPDQRHIRQSDVSELGALVRSQPGVEFNIEGNPFPEFMDLVRHAKPHQCTLVPDSPQQATSDHGWNIQADLHRLKPVIAELHGLGCRVSLFMDAQPEQIDRLPETGADRIELYTQPYAAAFEKGDVDQVFAQYVQAAELAQRSGLGVNAGHDLNLRNLPKFCTIPSLAEVSIGHALISDALDMGLFNAVRAYLDILKTA